MSDNDCGQNQEYDAHNRFSHQAVGIETDGGGIPLGEVLKCLSSPERRCVLYYLQDHEIADIDELATEIVECEIQVQSSEHPTDQHERVTTRLVHTHLPKLANAHLIEYDRRSGSVRYSDPPSSLDNVLEALAVFENTLSP